MNFNEVRDYVKEKYSEPHRFYHTLAHIDKMLEHLDRIEWLNPEEKDILRLAIYFHDQNGTCGYSNLPIKGGDKVVCLS